MGQGAGKGLRISPSPLFMNYVFRTRKGTAMSHEVQFTNTPIFDMLARQYGYDRLIAGGPLQLREVRPAYTGRSTGVEGIRPKGVTLDEWNEVQTDDAVDAAPQSIGEDVPESMHMTPGFWKMNDEE